MHEESSRLGNRCDCFEADGWYDLRHGWAQYALIPRLRNRFACVNRVSELIE